MTSTNRTSLETALRRVLRDRDGQRKRVRAPGARSRSANRRAPADPSSVARELDWFRRGQGLPYWHRDRRSD